VGKIENFEAISVHLRNLVIFLPLLIVSLSAGSGQNGGSFSHQFFPGQAAFKF